MRERAIRQSLPLIKCGAGVALITLWGVYSPFTMY